MASRFPRRSNGSRASIQTRGAHSNQGRDRRSSYRREDDNTMGFIPENVFQIRHTRHYSGPSDILEKPEVLGCYSVNGEREFCHDQSLLKFLDRKYLPEDRKMNVNLDLNIGWDKFNRYSGKNEETFQNFLRWILNNQDCLVNASRTRLTADFITIRKNLTRIMNSPYNWNQSWTMHATKYKGSIYMMPWKSEETQNMGREVVVDLNAKCGHTFEHIMAGGDPEDGIDANEEYRCVLKSGISGNSLLYAPEVDCVDPEQYEQDFKDMEAFVLVKCSKSIRNERELESFRRWKMIQFWVENQLSGIPRILVGFRDNIGIVHTIEQFKTDELPEMCQGAWEPNVCLNFLTKFLSFVKKRVSRDPGATYVFEREARGDIWCTKLTYGNSINILPTWYTNGLFAEELSDEKTEQAVSN